MNSISPTERARRIVEEFDGKTFSNTHVARAWLQQRIERAITLEIKELAERYGFLIVTNSILKD